MPYFRGSSITHSLSSLLYPIDTRESFDFCEYVFEQVVRHVESYVMKLSIGLPYLISGIFINKKSDIVTIEDELSVSHVLLIFSNKLFSWKHVPDNVFPNILHIDESNLVVDENMIDVPPMSGMMRSHLLKSFMKEAREL